MAKTPSATASSVLLTALNVGHPLVASVLIRSFAIIGTALGLVLINSLGRRALLLGSTAIFTLALLLLGVKPWATGAVVVALFITFNVAEAAGSGPRFVYPNELFPTDLRGTGMGTATAMSRIGAAAGTAAGTAAAAREPSRPVLSRHEQGSSRCLLDPIHTTPAVPTSPSSARASSVQHWPTSSPGVALG